MAESVDPEKMPQRQNDEMTVSGGPAEGAPQLSRWAAAALVAVAILLFAAIRWRVREMPLERDEGEYAYAGQLMLQGIPPYELAYNMKLPGTYAAYAAILRVFGETAAGIHLGMLVVNGCTTLLLYFVGRRLSGRVGGVTAAASYGMLSTSEALLGLSGHATHFVVLLAVPGILLLLTARESKDWKLYFAGGLCMGAAFVMKQPGAVFIIFGAQEVVWSAWKEMEERKRLGARLLAYGAGAAIPYLATCVVLWRAGVFGRFWFWTVSYASQYAANTGVAEGVVYLWRALPEVFSAAPVVWCFGLAGLVILLVQQKLRAALSVELSLLFWSFVATSAGLYFRMHYFILLLPAASLLAGKAMEWLAEPRPNVVHGKRLRVAAATGFVVAYGIAIYAQRANFFESSPATVIRAKYGGNPFPEAIEFGKYIREHSETDARVAVLGSEPEIYFYAKRHSATGYIYTYPLMEGQKFASKMQQEMIGEIEQAKPEYLVKVLVPASWLRTRDSDASILDWGEKYIGENYRVVGVAEIGLQTNYRWDEDAVGFTPHSKYSMFLYKRKI